ncbi:MAG: acyl carrier protein [Tissierellia bacterium]|nr:acyl carrier protein [Tissierellia bacterium]NLW41946.1 acyl carrier protein [Tissierellia bacterium]
MFEQLRDVIVENLGVSEEEVTLESSLIDDLGADSLDAVELSMAIEDEFDVEIEDEEFQELKTVGDILRAIEEKK